MSRKPKWWSPAIPVKNYKSRGCYDVWRDNEGTIWELDEISDQPTNIRWVCLDKGYTQKHVTLISNIPNDDETVHLGNYYSNKSFQTIFWYILGSVWCGKVTGKILVVYRSNTGLNPVDHMICPPKRLVLQVFAGTNVWRLWLQKRSIGMLMKGLLMMSLTFALFFKGLFMDIWLEIKHTVQWCSMDINVLQNLTGKPEFRSESAPDHADWMDLSGLIICLSKREQTSNIVRGPAEISTRTSCSWCHPILPPCSMCTMWPPAWVTWLATRLTELMVDNIYRSAYVGWTTSHNDLGKKTAIPKSNIIGDGIQPTYPHLKDTMGNTSLVAPI